jgi:hypothetical protein
MRRLVWPVLLALMPAACNGLSPRAPESLAGVPDLRPVVQRYYEARATEENGRCRAPLLDGVLNATVLQEDAQRLVVRIRYLYRDHTAELRGACIGFGNRTFTIDKGQGGLMVVDMSGAQHPRGLRLRLAS